MKKLIVLLFLTLGIAPGVFADDSTPVTPVPAAYTLEKCIEMALKQSPAVLSAAREVERTNGVVWETWSNIVSADISATYTDIEPGSPATISPLNRRGGVTVNLEGSIPIFSGGRVISGILTAYLERNLAREQYRQAVNNTIYNVIAAFDSVLLDRELVKVNKEQVDFLTQTYDTTKSKYDVGMASWYELLRTQVDLTNAEPALLQSQDALESDTDILKKLLGMDVGQPLDIDGELIYRELTFSLEDCLAKAGLSNPGIAIAYIREDIARKQVRSVIGEYFPTVSAFGNYEFSSSDVEISFNDRDWDFIGGITITMPITDLLATSARLKQARALYEEAKIARGDFENGIKAQVKKAYKDFVRSSKVVESQKQNILLAKEGLDIAVLQYDNGVTTYLDLINARLALTQANLNYINAVYSYLDAATRLENLMGQHPEPVTTETPAPTDGAPLPKE